MEQFEKADGRKDSVTIGGYEKVEQALIYLAKEEQYQFGEEFRSANKVRRVEVFETPHGKYFVLTDLVVVDAETTQEGKVC